MRKAMVNIGTQEATEKILQNVVHTRTNADFIELIKKIGLED